MRIADAISQLKDKLAEFASDLNEAQKPVFINFIFALLTNRFRGAVSSLSRHPMVNASEDQLNHFLCRGAVSKLRLDEIIRHMIAVVKSKVRRKSAFLIIDDTLAEKRGEKIDGLGWHYDHAKKGHLWGQKIVLRILVIDGMRLPIEALLQQKEKEKATTLFRCIDSAGRRYIIQIYAPTSRLKSTAGNVW